MSFTCWDVYQENRLPASCGTTDEKFRKDDFIFRLTLEDF
jgi:hypothetical protein